LLTINFRENRRDTQEWTI